MKDVKQANKGMSFEKEIESVNQIYDIKGIATITKIPTPWKVVRGPAGKIRNAFPEKKSVCDFLGVKRGGVPVAFEAKESSNKTSFPLSRIEPHQWEFLKKWNIKGADVFLLVHMSYHNEVYKIPMDDLLKFENRMLSGGRKSITREEMGSWIVKESGGALDYL